MSEPRMCVVCQRTELEPTERQTCVACIARTRSAILEIVELYALLPEELEARAAAAAPLDPTGIRGTDTPMPGGDVLVMLAHGSTMWRTTEDIDSVAGILDRWANDWREHLGMTVKLRMQPVTETSTFLLRGLARMLQDHPAAAEFARDMRRLRDQIAWITRHGDPRESAAVDCPDCGDTLRKPYVDPDPCPPGCQHRGHGHDQGGRRDWWVCRNRSCGRIVEAAEYWLAVRQRMENREAV